MSVVRVALEDLVRWIPTWCPQAVVLTLGAQAWLQEVKDIMEPTKVSKASIGIHLLRFLGTSRSRIACLTACVVVSACFFACDVLDEPVDLIEDVSEQITNDSTEWRRALENLVDRLLRDGRSALAQEVSDVLQRGIASAGVEVRCGADFVGSQVVSALDRLVASLRNEIVPSPEPEICSVVPSVVDFRPGADVTNHIELYGYNFDSLGEELPIALTLEDNDSQTLDVTNALAITTPYLMTIDLGTSGVPLTVTSSKLRLAYGSKQEEINVIQGPGCGGVAQSCCPGNACDGYACRNDVCVSFGVESNSTTLDELGGDGGTVFREQDCPEGYVAVGFNVQTGNELDSIQLLCRELLPDGNLGRQVSLPEYGGTGGNSFTLACQRSSTRQQMLTGVDVTIGEHVLNSIRGHCASIDGALRGTSEFQTPLRGDPGGKNRSSTCPRGAVVVGLWGRAGDRIDAIALRCADLVRAE